MEETEDECQKAALDQHEESDGRPRALHCGRLEQTPVKDQFEQPVKKLWESWCNWE